MNNAIVFWGGPNDEHLQHETLDAYIEAVLDESEPIPETIVAIGYARIPVAIQAGLALKTVLDALDEEYGNPYDVALTQPTTAMTQAEETFLAAVAREYVPYTCVAVSCMTINVADWRKTRKPPSYEKLAPGKAIEYVWNPPFSSPPTWTKADVHAALRIANRAYQEGLDTGKRLAREEMQTTIK